MWESKRIFFSSIDFLLHCLCPTKAELLYIDTDSVHFALADKELEKNVWPEKLNYFKENAHHFLAHYPNSLCYGVLESEGVFIAIRYRGEKMYQKEKEPGTCISSTKGINKRLKRNCIDNPSTLFFNPAIRMCQLNSIILRTVNNTVYIKNESKNLMGAMIPTKRYFSKDGHSKVFT